MPITTAEVNFRGVQCCRYYQYYFVFKNSINRYFAKSYRDNYFNNLAINRVV
ncbi:hypothetical protein yrohd0001_11400 [Yersinia rohdei ATCC 43380]|nr:hypothetical protein yrohd0001_11400 [Yersinia rohdei ATCC 43380]